MAEITKGTYASQWSLTDFYPDCAENFRGLVESGEDFEVSFGCKKEIRYATVRRDSVSVRVSVTEDMDDLCEGDLVYDALYSRFGSEKDIPDYVFDMILDEAASCGISDSTTCWDVLPRDVGYDEIVEDIERLEQRASEVNEDMYMALCDIVEAYCR